MSKTFNPKKSKRKKKHGFLKRMKNSGGRKIIKRRRRKKRQRLSVWFVMLPKINCLKADRDFKKVFSEGKTSEGNLIKIRFLKNFKKHSRFGFIISNTFESKAVSRNLIKRRLRAAVYFLLKNIKPGFDIIIWPKAALKKSTYQSILNNFKNTLINNALLFI